MSKRMTSSEQPEYMHTSFRDELYMREALKVARKALEVGEVPVGCVVVLEDHPLLPQGDSVIISHGSNQVNATRDATRHAEVVAIDRLLTQSASTDYLRLPPSVETKAPPNGIQVPLSRAAKENHWDDAWNNVPGDATHWKNSFGWTQNQRDELKSVDIFQHCSLYVTCEPCIMCAAALATIGIRRVVFGCCNDRFGGNGSLLHLHRPEDRLPRGIAKSRGYDIKTGVLEKEAITLLRSFYDRENFHAPQDKRKRKNTVIENK